MPNRFKATTMLFLLALTAPLLGGCDPIYERVQLVQIGGGGMTVFQGSNCGITKRGKVVCWSTPPRDHKDEGPILDDGFLSTEEYSPSGRVMQLIGNDLYACYLQQSQADSAAGQPYCWGWNVAGKPTLRELPEPILELSTGRSHACGVSGSGKAYCAGYNTYAQLGTGVASGPVTDVKASLRWVPQEVTVVTGKISAIAAGDRFTCAIISGEVSCWGRSLGDKELMEFGNYWEMPATLPSQPAPAVLIRAGANYACFLTASGDVYCWGSNDSGQLGIARLEPDSAPLVRVPDLPMVANLALGRGFACALTVEAEVFCWGHVSNSVTSPIKLTGIKKPVRQLAAFGNDALALHPDGSLSWWGDVDAPRTAFLQKSAGYAFGPLELRK